MYGHGSSGKTTLMEMVKMTLGKPYVICLPKNTFDKGNTKKDKILNTITSQTRYIFIQELSDKAQESDDFKELADGRVETTELYKDGVRNINVYAKMTFNSNNLISVKLDSGISRRIIGYQFKNTFTSDNTQVDNKTIFEKDKDLLENFMQHLLQF